MEELLKLRDDAMADGDAELVAELDAKIKELSDETEEDDEPEEDKPGLDWKEAGAHLKMAVADKSIDRYHKRDSIALCRALYNGKVRSQELFDAIMDL